MSIFDTFKSWFVSESEMNRFGWRPDIPDNRDLLMKTSGLLKVKELPSWISLRDEMPPVYDQGALGSCTAQAIAAVYDYCRKKQGKEFINYSRLFLYWCERQMEGTINVDAGAYIRDGIKASKKKGICIEKLWPYNIKKFKAKPTDKCFNNALRHQSLSYYRVSHDVEEMKQCIANGFPFVFGFSVYESFMDVGNTGVAHLPLDGEQLLGGHAVVCVGYDDATQRFLVRNSWGVDWGTVGYFTMPYAYLENDDLSADFWAIQRIE